MCALCMYYTLYTTCKGLCHNDCQLLVSNECIMCICMYNWVTDVYIMLMIDWCKEVILLLQFYCCCILCLHAWWIWLGCCHTTVALHMNFDYSCCCSTHIAETAQLLTGMLNGLLLYCMQAIRAYSISSSHMKVLSITGII